MEYYWVIWSSLSIVPIYAILRLVLRRCTVRSASPSAVARLQPAHPLKGVPGCPTASVLVMATKRSIVDNATSGIAPRPRAWSIQTGQCSGTRRPPGAVFVPRQRDQQAARSNRRDALISALVTYQWRAQEGGDQPARSPWPPRRQQS